ncbi:hypothetical protein F5Y06DRAFT_274443 [Hypoxylon sp. FL0890]|nr:hypothetical protein F5Y06DRAFT_274443 [Hypoxylon sp. FL0890]
MILSSLSPLWTLSVAFLWPTRCKSWVQVGRQPRDAEAWAGIDLRNTPASLFQRDACSDTFGSDAANSICAPSSTLCCVRKGETYPSCVQELGMGWCCVGNGTNDNCYVDQPSECDSPNSVACVNLAPNTSSACCPRLTTCASGYEAAEDIVRCEIGYDDLMQLAATASETSTLPTVSTSSATFVSSSSSTSTTTTTSSSSTTSLSTESPISNENNDTEPDQTSSALAPGSIAGIVVGSVAGLALFVAMAYYFLRRRKARQTAVSYNGVDSNGPPGMQQDYNQAVYDSWYGSWQYSDEARGFSQPSELNSDQPPKELPQLAPERPPQELPG